MWCGISGYSKGKTDIFLSRLLRGGGWGPRADGEAIEEGWGSGGEEEAVEGLAGGVAAEEDAAEATSCCESGDGGGLMLSLSLLGRSPAAAASFDDAAAAAAAAAAALAALLERPNRAMGDGVRRGMSERGIERMEDFLEGVLVTLSLPPLPAAAVSWGAGEEEATEAAAALTPTSRGISDPCYHPISTHVIDSTVISQCSCKHLQFSDLII